MKMQGFVTSNLKQFGAALFVEAPNVKAYISSEIADFVEQVNQAMNDMPQNTRQYLVGDQITVDTPKHSNVASPRMRQTTTGVIEITANFIEHASYTGETILKLGEDVNVLILFWGFEV